MPPAKNRDPERRPPFEPPRRCADYRTSHFSDSVRMAANGKRYGNTRLLFMTHFLIRWPFHSAHRCEVSRYSLPPGAGKVGWRTTFTPVCDCVAGIPGSPPSGGPRDVTLLRDHLSSDFVCQESVCRFGPEQEAHNDTQPDCGRIDACGHQRNGR